METSHPVHVIYYSFWQSSRGQNYKQYCIFQYLWVTESNLLGVLPYSLKSYRVSQQTSPSLKSTALDSTIQQFIKYLNELQLEKTLSKVLFVNNTSALSLTFSMQDSLLLLSVWYCPKTQNLLLTAPGIFSSLLRSSSFSCCRDSTSCSNSRQRGQQFSSSSSSSGSVDDGCP